jgi:hypothetical protein
MSRGLDFGGVNNPTKNSMIKHLLGAMESSSPKKFFNGLDQALAKNILEELYLPLEKGKPGEALLSEAANMGLENCFSSFTAKRLAEFAAGSGLTVESGAFDVVMNCLIERKDFKQPKTKKETKEEVEKSKTKPALEKGISDVDLNSWFYREDLAEYCKSNGLPFRGNKAELIREIKQHLNGGAPKKKKRKGEPLKQKPPKKAKKETPKKTEPKPKATEETKEAKETPKKKAQTTDSPKKSAPAPKGKGKGRPKAKGTPEKTVQTETA